MIGRHARLSARSQAPRWLRALATVVCVLVCTVVWAQDEPTTSALTIVSDKLVVDDASKRAEFTGNVEVRHDSLHLKCQTLVAEYDSEGRPVLVAAKGAVKVAADDLFATAESATYDRATTTIVLTGRPRLWRGAQRVSGQRMTIVTSSRRIEIDKPRGLVMVDMPTSLDDLEGP